MDTIGESISLVNTGENLVSKDSLDREYALCYMQREFYPNTDDGFRERFITPSGARLFLPAECLFVQFSKFSSSHAWVKGLRNYSSLLTKGGVREDKRYGQVVQ